MNPTKPKRGPAKGHRQRGKVKIRQRVAQLLGQGLSPTQIARVMNTSGPRVHYLLRTLT